MKTVALAVTLLGLWIGLTDAASTAFPTGPIKPGFPFPIPPPKPEKCAAQKCSCNCNYGGPAAPYKQKKDGCEWKMVFKAVNGNGRDVHDDFLNGGDMNGDVHQALDITSAMPYRNAEILDNWNKGIIKKVKVEVFAGGIRKAWFLFDGIATSMTNWFSQSRLIASPYEDLKTASLNFDSIDGHVSIERRFFLNDNYGGCNNDCGYLVVLDPDTHPCPWENTGAHPLFLYGKKKDSCSTWNVADEVGMGDRFVISVKYCDIDW